MPGTSVEGDMFWEAFVDARAKKPEGVELVEQTRKLYEENIELLKNELWRVQNDQFKLKAEVEKYRKEMAELEPEVAKPADPKTQVGSTLAFDCYLSGEFPLSPRGNYYLNVQHHAPFKIIKVWIENGDKVQFRLENAYAARTLIDRIPGKVFSDLNHNNLFAFTEDVAYGQQFTFNFESNVYEPTNVKVHVFGKLQERQPVPVAPRRPGPRYDVWR